MPTRQTILDLAYALWQARGSPQGSPQVDWSEAERQVLMASKQSSKTADAQDRSLKDSFPARDPRASMPAAGSGD